MSEHQPEHQSITRLSARYGHPPTFTPPTWNETIDLILRHHSVRQWREGVLDDATLQTIIAAAQSAPSSSNKQVISVVAIRDDEAKQRLAAVGKQMSAHIVDAAVTLVWLIDFSQGRFLAEQERTAAHINSDAESGENSSADSSALSGPGHGVSGRPPTDLGSLDYIDEPMMAAADIGIAAQTAAIAAESLGYGTVFLGSLRNDIAEVKEILGIPDSVIPYLGLEIGIPDPEENAGVKPRLPMDLFLHRDRYNSRESATDRQEQADLLASYNDALASYYSRYGLHPRWSDQLLGRLSGRATEKSRRRFFRSVLEQAGFGLK